MKKPVKDFQFSTCGIIGNIGPTQLHVDSFYTNFSVKIIDKGIQKWIVPFSGLYLFEAVGASGSSACSQNKDGRGAKLKSQFHLYKDEILYILVGQMGKTSDSTWGGSGGGATFIARKRETSSYYFELDSCYIEPLLIASGGGGSGDCNGAGTPKQGEDGHTETMPDGKGTFTETGSSGGAGFSFDAEQGTKSFLNGGIGGERIGSQTSYGYGGFGCGGNPHNAGGGGGGYRGGNANAAEVKGNGGYSFNKGKLISSSHGQVNESGFVNILFISPVLECTHVKSSSSSFTMIILIIFYK